MKGEKMMHLHILIESTVLELDKNITIFFFFLMQERSLNQNLGQTNIFLFWQNLFNLFSY